MEADEEKKSERRSARHVFILAWRAAGVLDVVHCLWKRGIGGRAGLLTPGLGVEQAEAALRTC